MNLTQVFVNITGLGAEWVLWLLVGLSLVSMTVMIERWLYFLTHGVSFANFSSQLESLLRAGKLTEAYQLASQSRAPECAVAAAGLANFKKSSEAVSESMLSTKSKERVKMEAYLTVLATLGNNVPFVGLLGTVLGIIKASGDLAKAQAEKAASSSAVMGGVFEALVATAVGLFVAIPAVIAYNYFQRNVKIRMGQVDAVAHQLLALHAQKTTFTVTPPEPPPVKAGLAEPPATKVVGRQPASAE
ncbi:MotA/TolQ/ExbB proton channel family protein [Anatilimnocola floriformis]|uniref:MotA/TolQ/ExbB proton channel family protein n=1 Tax=Anatilimnocola floriformis TaxID=2948575 RepID=UPI0020C557FC|nr:MotA/TolQ/ExbB proton channel family protein [Anatilimnocola floriformis]